MKKLLMSLVLMPFLALSYETETVNGYTWSYEIANGGVEICGVSPKPTGTITIPSKLGGYQVTSIGFMALVSCELLTSVTISEGITSIGPCAFAACYSLTSITIPSSVIIVENDIIESCPVTTVYVDSKSEIERVKKMIAYSGFVAFEYLDYVVKGGGTGGGSVSSSGSGTSGEIEAGDFSVKHTFCGIVCDGDGAMCGLAQIATAKETKKGVSVSGFVMLEDGKKYSLKAAYGSVANGKVKVTTKVGKLGEAEIEVGGNGFYGTLGSMTFESAELGEDTGILKATVKMSYFDQKTGKIKTKSLTLGGCVDGDEAVGTITDKSQRATISFAAELD